METSNLALIIIIIIIVRCQRSCSIESWGAKEVCLCLSADYRKPKDHNTKLKCIDHSCKLIIPHWSNFMLTWSERKHTF